MLSSFFLSHHPLLHTSRMHHRKRRHSQGTLATPSLSVLWTSIYSSAQMERPLACLSTLPDAPEHAFQGGNDNITQKSARGQDELCPPLCVSVGAVSIPSIFHWPDDLEIVKHICTLRMWCNGAIATRTILIGYTLLPTPKLDDYSSLSIPIRRQKERA